MHHPQSYMYYINCNNRNFLSRVSQSCREESLDKERNGHPHWEGRIEGIRGQVQPSMNDGPNERSCRWTSPTWPARTLTTARLVSQDFTALGTGSPRRTCASKGGGNRRDRARWARHWNWSLYAGGIASRVLFMSDHLYFRTIASYLRRPTCGPEMTSRNRNCESFLRCIARLLTIRCTLRSSRITRAVSALNNSSVNPSANEIYLSMKLGYFKETYV